MKKAISVGKGFGKKAFDEGIKASHVGDVVVIDPGTYVFPNGFNVGNLRLRGNGQQPGDVVINSHFSLKENGYFEVENLTIQESEHNIISNKRNGTVILNRTILDSRTEETYPALWTEGGNVTLTNSEIRQANGEGLYCLNGANILLSKSVINGVWAKDGSVVDVQTTQILRDLGGVDNSQYKGSDVYFSGPAGEDNMITLRSGSQFVVDALNFDCPQTTASLTHALLKAGSSNLSDQIRLTVSMDEQSSAEVEGAEVRLVGVSSTPTEPEPKPEKKPAPVAETQEPEEKVAEIEAEPEESALDELNAMIGLDKVKEAVTQFIRLAVFNQKRKEQGLKGVAQSYHSLYLGNPGTGKTTVARLVGKIMFEEGILPKDNYVEVSRQDLVSQNVGGTAIQTKKILEKALGGVLFIDEAYTLYQDGGSVNWGQEAVDTILKFMEDHRDDLMIIFAGYTKEMKDFMHMNPGLISRAPNIFDFQDYTGTEVVEIGMKLLDDQQFTFNRDLYATTIEDAYKMNIENSNGRWVRNFNEKLVRIVANNCIEDPDRDVTAILDSDLNEIVGGDEQEKEAKVQALLTQIDQLVGLDEVKDFVHKLVDRVAGDRKLKGALPEDQKPTYHMVFAGNPGTGKTTVARILAQLFYNLGILEKKTVMEVGRPDLVGQYIGQTEQKTANAVRDAMGGVLFVDEAYQLTASGNGSNDFGKQAVEALITQLENNRDKFIAIFAGYTDQMDEFLGANPGLRSRIPLTLNFADYTPDEIGEIVCRTLRKKWHVNESLLRHLVANKYASLPAEEKSNGRWARNFTDKLIQNDKNWLVANLETVEDVTAIPDDVVIETAR
ncbi:AAA family ATPase [Levilactobacillus huananensis]|uniref:AAA family ATPase n=1 Tax=Levilactobacillus huananensis TaxID=2486019 RepID=UPI000F7749F7|nr:AAA family ATPase [Levilactobacillus huananensis]